jgi:hypothetical protein
MYPIMAVRDREGREPGPGLAMWTEVDVTCRLQDGMCARDHGAREVVETGQPVGVA